MFSSRRSQLLPEIPSVRLILPSTLRLLINMYRHQFDLPLPRHISSSQNSTPITSRTSLHSPPFIFSSLDQRPRVPFPRDPRIPTSPPGSHQRIASPTQNCPHRQPARHPAERKDSHRTVQGHSARRAGQLLRVVPAPQRGRLPRSRGMATRALARRLGRCRRAREMVLDLGQWQPCVYRTKPGAGE